MHGRPVEPEESQPHPRVVEPWSAIQLFGRLCQVTFIRRAGTGDGGRNHNSAIILSEKGQTVQVHCGGGAVSKHENSYLRFPASCDERPHHLAETGSSRTELAGAGDRPDCRRITSWKSWCFWPDGRARGHGATSGGKASQQPRRGLLYLGKIFPAKSPWVREPNVPVWLKKRN